MTGRNPWVVLCVAEDAPYHEIQRAYRRRVKQTHPDSGGDAGEFASVVQAFGAVRQTISAPISALPRCHPARPTPYDSWIRPWRPARSWTDAGPREAGAASWSQSQSSTPTDRMGESEFSTLLVGEMSKLATAVG